MVALPFNAHVVDVPIWRVTPAVPLIKRTVLYSVMVYGCYVELEALQNGGKDTAEEARAKRAPDKTTTKGQQHARPKDKKRA